MYKELLSQSSYLVWPLVALVIFFVTWIVVLINVGMSHRRGDRIDVLANLPLVGDEETESPEAKS